MPSLKHRFVPCPWYSRQCRRTARKILFITGYATKTEDRRHKFVDVGDVDFDLAIPEVVMQKLVDLRLSELFSLDWLPQRLFTLGADTAAPFSANTARGESGVH